MGIFEVPRHVQLFYVLNVPFLFIIVECLLKKRRVFTLTRLRLNPAYVMYFLGILLWVLYLKWKKRTNWNIALQFACYHVVLFNMLLCLFDFDAITRWCIWALRFICLVFWLCVNGEGRALFLMLSLNSNLPPLYF